MNYSNPRTELTVNDWPYGKKRVQAVFSVESGPKGERAVRVTENPRGGWNKPKKLTYAHKMRIVDGDDGRTYIAELTHFGFISIMKSDMKYQHETIPRGDSRYPELLNLFN